MSGLTWYPRERLMMNTRPTNPGSYPPSGIGRHRVRLRILLVLSLAGCASNGDGGKLITAPASASVSTKTAASPSISAAPLAQASLPSCRLRKPVPNDPIESVTQAVRQPYGKNIEVDYSGLVETNTPLWRFLPTLSEAGHVTSIAPTFTDGPHGPMYGALIEKPEREADGATSTSLHLGFATAACVGGEHAWLEPFVPLSRGRSGAITMVESIWLSGQDPVTGLRVIVDTLPLPGFDRVSPTSEVFEFLVGEGRPGMPVLDPKGAEFGILGRISNLAGKVAPPTGASAAEPFEDILLFGSGFYPLEQGAAMLVYHRRGPAETREVDSGAKGKPSEPPSFYPPSFRLVARIDDQGFSTTPSRVGVAYLIAISTNQPPADVCDKPLSGGTNFVCRTAQTHLERYIDGAEAQWFVGLFPDPVSVQKVMMAYHIKGKVYATEPAPGSASPALLDGKPVPWVLEGRPPKPDKSQLHVRL